MDLTRMRRAIVLTAMTALAVSACSSSGGNASPSAAASAAATAAASVAAPTATPEPSAAAVTLKYLVDDRRRTSSSAKALADAYTAMHPNVTINVESRPGGTEGDNLVKTTPCDGRHDGYLLVQLRLAAPGPAPDRHARRPPKEPFIANIVDSFLPTVSQNGQIFGVPSRHGDGRRYPLQQEDLRSNGLSVPKTWAEFEANNDKIKAAGIAPVIATYGRRLDLPAVRARRLLQRRAGRPELRRRLHRQQGQVRRRPLRRWPASAICRRASRRAGIRRTSRPRLRPRLEAARRRQGRPVPDAVLCALDHRDQLARCQVNDIGFFALPGTDAAKNWRDDLDARRDLHPEDDSKNLAEAKDFLAFIASDCRRRRSNRREVRPQARTSSRARSCPTTSFPP